MSRASETIVGVTQNASWLPAGGTAEVVRTAVPASPTGLVRLLLVRDGHAFCVPRSDSGKLDLPTREVSSRDEGRTAIAQLASEVIGTAEGLHHLGYVRNVVGEPAPDYPWPVPVAHFSVWSAAGSPRLEGEWCELSPNGLLADRHWFLLTQE